MHLWAFIRGRLAGKTAVTLVVLSLFIFDCFRWVNAIMDTPVNIELVSVSYPGKIVIRDREAVLKIYRQIRKAGAEKMDAGNGEKRPRITGNYQLNLVSSRGTRIYLFDGPEHLLEMKSGRLISLGDGGECLRPYLKELEEEFRYGRMLPWEQVDRIFPRFAYARVRDLETGMSFRVQRRAGSRHADVQPVTAEDTRVMKQIYGGQWSWERRAVIVEINGWRLAASMNGMPHGAGAIRGNDFDGHFCIHFLHSRLHSGSGGEDPGHQLMVWKAAGRVAQMLAHAGPDRMAAAMLTALAQRDLSLAMDMMSFSERTGPAEVTGVLQQVKWFAVADVKVAAESDDGSDSEGAGLNRGGGARPGLVRVETRVSFQLADGTRVENGRAVLELVKEAGKYPWKVTAGSAVRMLSREK